MWNELKEMYDYQKPVILPKARYNLMHLRLQDFKIVSKYNFALFKISSRLKLYREKITKEDKLEKHSLRFMSQMYYCNSNIESVDLPNILINFTSSYD